MGLMDKSVDPRWSTFLDFGWRLNKNFEIRAWNWEFQWNTRIEFLNVGGCFQWYWSFIREASCHANEIDSLFSKEIYRFNCILHESFFKLYFEYILMILCDREFGNLDNGE